MYRGELKLASWKVNSHPPPPVPSLAFPSFRRFEGCRRHRRHRCRRGIVSDFVL